MANRGVAKYDGHAPDKHKEILFDIFVYQNPITAEPEEPDRIRCSLKMWQAFNQKHIWHLESLIWDKEGEDKARRALARFNAFRGRRSLHKSILLKAMCELYLAGIEPLDVRGFAVRRDRPGNGIATSEKRKIYEAFLEWKERYKNGLQG